MRKREERRRGRLKDRPWVKHGRELKNLRSQRKIILGCSILLSLRWLLEREHMHTCTTVVLGLLMGWSWIIPSCHQHVTGSLMSVMMSDETITLALEISSLKSERCFWRCRDTAVVQRERGDMSVEITGVQRRLPLCRVSEGWEMRARVSVTRPICSVVSIKTDTPVWWRPLNSWSFTSNRLRSDLRC